MTLPFDPAAVAPRLLAWYGAAGRELPWRQTRDPYCIWLSEIMLQQTTVAAVIPYYQRFLAVFPTVQALAAAPLDRVLELWAGLGYYSRARNLHRAALQIVGDYAGRFPAEPELLAALPGVGRSTAGAIAAIAFDRPAPILDGNVRRVLVRLFAWRDDPRSASAERQLWSWAEALTSRERPHDYSQAIMDLGATVCTPQAPACAICPLAALCQAHRLDLAAELPVKRRQPALPVRQQVALLLEADGAWLVRQRPPQGLLGGMWEFPGAERSGAVTPATTARRLLQDLGLTGRLHRVGEIRHAYSHFKLELTLFAARLPAGERVGEELGRWCDPGQLETLPLHGAHRKAWELLRRQPGRASAQA